jgi:hypothetical protein
MYIKQILSVKHRTKEQISMFFIKCFFKDRETQTKITKKIGLTLIGINVICEVPFYSLPKILHYWCLIKKE